MVKTLRNSNRILYMQQSVDILILTCNRPEYFEKMLNALRRQTGFPFRLIVVDNASEQDMVMRLRRMHEKGLIDVLICNPVNEFMGGWRHGLKHITSPLFALSDPDIVVPDTTPCWLTQMTGCFERMPDLVRLGVSLSSENIPPCWNKFEARFLCLRAGKRICQNPLLRSATADTTLQLIRTDSFWKIGGFSAETIDFEFLKKLRTQGICAVHQDISAVHLGWNEYKDYPEYLRRKNALIRPYREVSLIEDRPQ
jgi:hypothetical protein